MTVLLFAVAIDLAIGHPQWRFHPVRLLGNFIHKLERLLYPKNDDKQTRAAATLRGVVLLLATIAASSSIAYAVLLAAALYGGPFVEIVVGVVMVYFCIALKDLAKEASKISRLVEINDLTSARHALKNLVSRDPSALGEVEIRRAAVESLAENITDSFVAPLFYAVIFGPIGAVFYRTVNTLDAMVGYRNDRYIWFGWGSARLDDLLNFIPARITGFSLLLLANLVGRRSKGEVVGKISRRGHPSPNAWIPEAYFARLLAVRLGGTNTYFGSKDERPEYGPAVPVSGQSVSEAIKLMYLVMIASLSLLALVDQLKQVLV